MEAWRAVFEIYAYDTRRLPLVGRHSSRPAPLICILMPDPMGARALIGAFVASAKKGRAGHDYDASERNLREKRGNVPEILR